MSFDIISTESDSTLTSTSTPITIYYKPIPFLDTPTVHEEISYRQKDLSLGPFHPSLGLVPLEATISRQIYSSQLHDLLRKFSTIPLGFLEPPTTTDIPDADKRIDAFRVGRWPYILHDVYFPAERAWLERIVLPSPLIPPPPYPTTDTLDQWYKEVIPDQLVDDALEEWNETALYAQIMRMSLHCYDYRQDLEEYGKLLAAYIADPNNLKTSLSVHLSDLIDYDKLSDQAIKKRNRQCKYGGWCTFDWYPDPKCQVSSTPTSKVQQSTPQSAPSSVFQTVFLPLCDDLGTISNLSFDLSPSDLASSRMSTFLSSSLSTPSKSDATSEEIDTYLKKLSLRNQTGPVQEEEITQTWEENSEKVPLLSDIIIKSDSKEDEPVNLIHRRKFDFDKEEEVLKKYV